MKYGVVSTQCWRNAISSYLGDGQTEVFDPSTNTWNVFIPLNTGTQLAASGLLSDGKVIVAGGETNFTSWSSSLNKSENFSY